MNRASLIGLLFLCSPALCAAQQYDDDSRGFRLKPASKDHREIAATVSPHVTLLRTAKCLADARTDEAKLYLRSVPASTGEDAAMAAFEQKIADCMPVMDMSSVGNQTRANGQMTMSFEHASLRGALAEELLRQSNTAIDPAKLQIGDDAIFAAERFHGARSDDQARAFSLGFAGCVTASNAATVAQLFETGPGSAEERRVIMQMAETFGPCVMEGQQLLIDPPALRHQLAEAVYYIHSGELGAQ